MNASPTILTGSFWNFAGVFVKVWRCAWSFAVILRLFWSLLLAVWMQHIDTGYLVNTSPTIFRPIFLKLCQCFCQGLKMCIKFGCNPQIIFVFFFFLQFELSHFLAQLLAKHKDTHNSYNFSRIFLKLCWCLILAQLLPKHKDTGNLVNVTPPIILHTSFWNYAGGFVMFWRCAWCWAVILRFISPFSQFEL